MEKVLVLVLSVIAAVCADTPANCTYEDVRGTWTFSIGEGGNERSLDCSNFVSGERTLQITLYFPDLAVDEYGNDGFWTLIYNQGFEIVISGRKYFAFSKYKTEGKNVTSICGETMPGWSHDTFDRNWACIVGKKNTPVPPKTYIDPLASGSRNAKNKNEPWTKINSVQSPYLGHKQYFVEMMRQARGHEPGRLSSPKVMYKNDHALIAKINSAQTSWKAVAYEEHEHYTVEEMFRRAGGRGSRILGRPRPAPVSDEVARRVRQIPDAFDWRNVEGSNYVSPIRNQASCGSCYAFASMAMNEARVRIMTNNTRTPVFSPQDIVDCSEYSQGCEGGFPYLIGGKYAEDFGLVEESCNPYTGKDGQCVTKQSCARHYAERYEYIGGFYGACNEELMKINLVKYGPVAVGFEVYKDFENYKGGIYHYTGLTGTFNPFEITNHAVLVVGYGADPDTGEKYWIVKNSWGEKWGEEGFFRIRRGTDECGIESLAVQSFPVL